eukprot:3878532-Rhodomonas_salina.1
MCWRGRGGERGSVLEESHASRASPSLRPHRGGSQPASPSVLQARDCWCVCVCVCGLWAHAAAPAQAVLDTCVRSRLPQGGAPSTLTSLCLTH